MSQIMRVAYLDCFSGISGDMCLAALIDAGANVTTLQKGIESLQIDARLEVFPVRKHAFRGLGLRITHPEQHAHRTLGDVHAILQRGQLPASVKDRALRIFERVAKAEAKVHGTTLDRVTFHEVGAIDSIVDIVGVSLAWEDLEIETAVASAIPTGTGQVRIAHGLVAIPAPATAELLAGVPIAACNLPWEMTTPTGAAIVCELVDRFGSLPSMQVARIGYGAGTRDLEDRPNLLRILLGDALPERAAASDHSIVILETNVDDTTGEQVGFAVEQLWRAGALDVYTSAVQMKKNRPGTLITVLAFPKDLKTMEQILFQQTGTLGVRHRRQARTVLPRDGVEVDSPWGIVPGKVCELPNGEVDFSPEYDACAEIARAEGMRLIDVMEEVRNSYFSADSSGAPKEDSEPPNPDTSYRWDSSPWPDDA